jgi:hypothetical protein
MDWTKSSYSRSNGNCLEWRTSSSDAQVRDSKDPDGSVLTFSGSTWGRFLAGVKAQ